MQNEFGMPTQVRNNISLFTVFDGVYNTCNILHIQFLYYIFSFYACCFFLQIYLTCGVFSLSPCFGILAPGAQQVVTVDCKAEHEGSWEECLAIDITDRDPSDNPDGIPYKLVTEVCMPGL